MTETTVVNVKVADIRPEYKDLEKWMKNKNNVYIGRRGVVFINNKRFPEHDSIWHNPFKINETSTREDVMRQYTVYIKNRLKLEPDLVKQLLKLKGKTLGCWCHPLQCHGDILVKMIKYYSKKKLVKKTTKDLSKGSGGSKTKSKPIKLTKSKSKANTKTKSKSKTKSKTKVRVRRTVKNRNN